MQDIEKQIKSKTSLKDVEHTRALEYVKSGKTDDAKRSLQKKKRLDENITSLLSMQLILETQVNTIQATLMQHDMIKVVDQANKVIKSTSVNPENAEQVLEEAREKVDNVREVNDILNQSIVPDVDVDAELEQLLAEDLIAPVPAPAPVSVPNDDLSDLVIPAVPQQAVRVALPG